ncbi:MAG: hypothetical protein CSA97_05205 [Bacteroidetes bacterium]|nr:MAG: hypothetical protein CSA97_05205 [Bacteroidota bacterium]
MGHGKETPRQKMIGMMYLVLTAMLAMNISADLLNAFTLVDSGLSQTTKNYARKNAKTLGVFEAAEASNPAKVKPWRMKAQEIHNMAVDLTKFVDEQKYKIVELAEGPESPALLEGGQINSKLIEAKSNTDIPAQVLILDGGAKTIREKVEAFRAKAVSLLDPERDSVMIRTIEDILNTDAPPPTEDGIQHSWESFRFEHIPLIATLPQLTKVQVDALNVEADLMSFLMNRVDAGDLRFNSISSVVIPTGDFITQGTEFKAQIFLAASDTTQRPKIYIGAYDSVKNKETGEWEYKMRNPNSKDTIPVGSDGRGIFRRGTGSLGTVRWGGLIEIKGPEGGVIRKPFKHSYVVAPSSFAVSPTKMNVFYQGVLNPIDVSVAGVPEEQVKVAVSGGSLVRKGRKLFVRAGRGKTCQVILTNSKTGKRIGVAKFRNKELPDPTASLIGLNTNMPSKGKLLKCPGITAKPKNFLFDIDFKVLSFTIEVNTGGVWLEAQSNGYKFSAKQKKLIRGARSGARMTLQNIKVKGPDGKVRTIQGLPLKLR